MSDLDDLRTAGPTIGRPIERREDERLLQGRGSYVGDMNRSGMLCAVILRSPVAHGRIVSIDCTAARDMPGVSAIFTAADMPQPVPRIPLRQEPLPSLVVFHQPVIAIDRVRYVGEPVAVVVADTRLHAEDALEAIQLEIEALPVIATRDQSEAAQTLLHEEAERNCAITLRAVRGDVDAAFRDAPYTRREKFSVHRHTALPLEPRGLLADWDPQAGKLTVDGATKVPFANRRILSGMIGLAEASIDILECDVGGGFGARGEFYPEDFLIPFAARQLARPVRWAETRSEHFLATNHARDADCDLQIACTRDGRVLGLRGRARTDVGAYLRTVGITPSRNIAQVHAGPYRVENIGLDVAVMMTNKTPVATYRAPGRYETDYFRERLFDLAADDLGIERAEFRRRNLIAPHEIPWKLSTVEPYGDSSTTDSGDYAAVLDRCLEEFDWKGKSTLNGQLIDGGWHGIAVGCYIEGGASGPRESSAVVLEADGRIAVHTGASAVGQGLETAFSQIAADALGVSLDRISAVRHGSTTLVKEGFGSYSSRSIVMGGSALVGACARLLALMRTVAGEKLGCTAAEIVLLDGQARAPDGRTLAWATLAEGGELQVEDTFSSSARTYSYGTHAAHVRVDAQTGEVRVLDYWAVEDVGRIINPLTLHGQTMGALVQGLGGTLLEELVYDNEGQLLAGSFMDYTLPRADDFPHLDAVLLEAYPSPNNPLGAKGAGEGGVIPVGGVIANAVSAALAPLGTTVHALPLSAQNVWRLIDQATHKH